ncbi:unnamed protein product, partial [Iphiclides podalirius]
MRTSRYDGGDLHKKSRNYGESSHYIDWWLRRPTQHVALFVWDIGHLLKAGIKETIYKTRRRNDYWKEPHSDVNARTSLNGIQHYLADYEYAARARSVSRRGRQWETKKAYTTVRGRVSSEYNGSLSERYVRANATRMERTNRSFVSCRYPHVVHGQVECYIICGDASHVDRRIASQL